MKKKDFLAMIALKLADLDDDDQVVVRVDWGDYWGDSYEDPEIRSGKPYGDVLYIGHPKSYVEVPCKRYAVIGEK